MEWILIALYLISLIYVFAFSMIQVHLTWYYRKWKIKEGEENSADDCANWPSVTVQLPVYNERYVAERLIKSVLKLDYPADKIEIQILDDSTDDTRVIIDQVVQECENSKLKVIRRTNRLGYKAGALQNGLMQAKGEYIAVFDADFLPEPEFLKKTIPYFKDQNTGMVQTRWGHLNESYSLVTRAQAFGLDAHFIVEQSGRFNADSFISFNGTAGVWKKDCILDAGGWSADTLTEDLDLSYRAQLKGWKFKYLEDVVSPGELPVLLSAIKSQQYRWNKGAAETAKKLMSSIMKSKMRPMQKLHAVFHLLNSSVYIPLIILSILSVPLLYVKQVTPNSDILLFFNLASVFVLGFAGISWFYWNSIKVDSTLEKVRYFAYRFPVFMSFYVGLSLHNAVAVLQGLSGRKTAFVRTPKFDILKNTDQWKGNIYTRSSLSWVSILEGLLGIYFLGGVAYGLFIRDFGLILFHLLLSIGFLWMFILSIKDSKVHA